MPSSKATPEELHHGIVLGNVSDVADATELVEFAAAAEEAGWDGVRPSTWSRDCGAGTRSPTTENHYTIDGVSMDPTPVQEPRIPIVTGGFWPNRYPIRRGARWDGIMPLSPGIRGLEDTGTRGDEVPESVEGELRELVGYYRGLTDDPGDVFPPIDVPGASPYILELYEELGVTWTLTTTWDRARRYNPSMGRIRNGPPA